MKHYLLSDNNQYLVDNDPILDNLAREINHAYLLGDATFQQNEYRSYVEAVYTGNMLDNFDYEEKEAAE